MGERPDRLHRDLRAMVGDGIAFSVMVGVGETYLAAFVLAAGIGELAAGLVSTLPLLAGALLQLVTPFGVRHLGSYRRWVVGCARMQALCFVPLIAGALAGSIPGPLVFATAAAYWGFGMATSPAWNAWVETLVARELRARFFARRARLAQAALLVSILAGGGLLNVGATQEEPLRIFALSFSLAACARLASSAFLASQSEQSGLAAQLRLLPVRRVLGTLTRGAEGRLLAYLLAMQAAVHVAAPFFSPYMLGPLGLSYAGFTILTSASFLARIAALPLIGRIAQRRGTRPILWVGALGTCPLPALWLVSDSFPYLLGLQLLAGTAWSALELATLLSFFESIGQRERASLLAAFNLANALAMALGSAAAGLLFRELAGGREAYAALFLLSSGARLLALGLLRRVPARPPGTHPMVPRTLAVRPSVGAIQRPVLASLSDEDAPPEERL
jgi:MFS family permease